MPDEDLHDEELEIEDIEDVEHEEGGAEADDAAEQDEGQADGETAGDEEVVASERKPSRGESRFQRLANEAREAREESARLRRELEQDRRERTAREQQAQRREPTADEMALWTPEQIIDYKLGKATSTFNQNLHNLQQQTMESNDKMAWESIKTRDARAARYDREVEQRLTELRAQGQNVAREALFKFILGEKVYAAQGKAPKQRKEGQQRIARQRVAPPEGRSDVAGGRQRDSEAEARRKRLENVTF
jgi:hypothetical protein